MEPEELRSHTYLQNKNLNDKLPVYAPTDIALTSGAYFNREGKRQNEYQLFFAVSCNYSLRFGHITEPVEKIRAAFPSQPALDSKEIQVNPQVLLKAGELIGYTTGNYPNHIWDLGVYDINHQNKFANPERFKEHFRLLHAVCPYDFFTDKSDYYKLLTNINGSPRSDCGGVEQDVVGTIAGQWFGNPVAVNSPSTWEKFIGISEFLSPGQIRIVGLGDSYQDSMWIEKNSNPTYKNPAEVRDEHCYSDGQQITFFKLLAQEKLAFYYQKGGTCPARFPQTGYKVFVR